MKMCVHPATRQWHRSRTHEIPGCQFARCILNSGRELVRGPRPPSGSSTDDSRYIVTPLMWTNLQSLLAKGPIANEFTQYFLYQILVRI